MSHGDGDAGEGAYRSRLTHIASRRMLAAGAAENTPENLAIWLHDPNKFKPGSNMPNLQLSTDDVRDLVAYLETLK